MLGIINKVGGYKQAHDILKSNGWNGKKTTLCIQSYRKKVSAPVQVILMDYCFKHGIKVKPEDFKGE